MNLFRIFTTILISEISSVCVCVYVWVCPCVCVSWGSDGVSSGCVCAFTGYVNFIKWMELAVHLFPCFETVYITWGFSVPKKFERFHWKKPSGSNNFLEAVLWLFSVSFIFAIVLVFWSRFWQYVYITEILKFPLVFKNDNSPSYCLYAPFLLILLNVCFSF